MEMPFTFKAITSCSAKRNAEHASFGSCSNNRPLKVTNDSAFSTRITPASKPQYIHPKLWPIIARVEFPSSLEVLRCNIQWRKGQAMRTWFCSFAPQLSPNDSDRDIPALLNSGQSYSLSNKNIHPSSSEIAALAGTIPSHAGYCAPPPGNMNATGISFRSCF